MSMTDPIADLLARIRNGIRARKQLIECPRSNIKLRLAEILPLPLPIKQSMLEINDSEVRLKVLAQFLKQQELI